MYTISCKKCNTRVAMCENKNKTLMNVHEISKINRCKINMACDTCKKIIGDKIFLFCGDCFTPYPIKEIKKINPSLWNDHIYYEDIIKYLINIKCKKCDKNKIKHKSIFFSKLVNYNFL